MRREKIQAVMRIIARLTIAGLLLFALDGCSRASRSSNVQSGSLPTTESQAHRAHPADVRFMADMIRHHAQALLIAGWIPTHGTNKMLRRLGERMIAGQQSETALMQQWLQDRNELVPASPHARSPGAAHATAEHSAAMPGMLTAEQMAQLDEARGPAFDRLFLKFMIIHHRGALVMADQLMDAPGAAQDDTVFRLASEIQAGQSSEINRMQKMLDASPSEDPAP